MKRPSFQFYPADWQKDAALRCCSLAARGLWIELLCAMHQCDQYGYLRVNGNAIDATQISRIVGETEVVVKRLLAELDQAGVFGRDVDGAIYSRRMLRDEHIRKIRSEAGKLGGNPTLLKQLDNQADNHRSKQAPTPSSSSSASSSSSKQKRVQLAARFDDFWNQYPLKKGRTGALRTWQSRKLDDIADRIIADVMERSQSDRKWLAGYIPHGSTYVNGSIWEDAIERGCNVVPHPAVVHDIPSPPSQRAMTAY